MSTKKRSKLNAYGRPFLTCPDCGSADVAVTEESSVMVNTGEHYCHSVKAYDRNAKARCTVCCWGGQRQDLKEQPK